MIGVVIAMQSEADILLDEMQISRSLTVSGKKVHVGKAYGKDIALCICGVGKVNAALGSQLLVSKFDAEKLLNFGVSGGLNKSTKLCQVYQRRALAPRLDPRRTGGKAVHLHGGSQQVGAWQVLARCGKAGCHCRGVGAQRAGSAPLPAAGRGHRPVAC